MACAFTQYDIQKACNGAKRAGLAIDRVSVGIDGEIVVHIATEKAPSPLESSGPEVDGLDKWGKLYENRHAKA